MQKSLYDAARLLRMESLPRPNGRQRSALCPYGYAMCWLFASSWSFRQVSTGFSSVPMLIAGSLVMVRKVTVYVCLATMRCMALKGYGVGMPCDFEVHGVDMSHYQGHIDWPRLAEHRAGEFPIRFIFMKATEGGDHQDDTFRQNFDSAKTYRFIRGAYHYFLPRTDALKQADFFIRTVPLTAGDLPPVLDVETTGKKDKAELQACVKTWLDRVEAHYGVKPILYTSYKFKMRYLDSPVFDAYPYWIAHYYVDSVRYQGPWHFWQHTDVGTVPGIEKEVDLNVFNGTSAQLDSLLLK